jgi:hypothetical protein
MKKASLAKEKKERLLKAKIAVAMQDEFGRVPTTEEIEKVFHLTRIMYKAVLGLHYKRREMENPANWRFFNTYADWLRPRLNH